MNKGEKGYSFPMGWRKTSRKFTLLRNLINLGWITRKNKYRQGRIGSLLVTVWVYVCLLTDSYDILVFCVATCLKIYSPTIHCSLALSLGSLLPYFTRLRLRDNRKWQKWWGFFSEIRLYTLSMPQCLSLFNPPCLSSLFGKSAAFQCTTLGIGPRGLSD